MKMFIKILIVYANGNNLGMASLTNTVNSNTEAIGSHCSSI